MKCPNLSCGGTVVRGNQHCHSCASPLVFCAVCSVANRSEAHFCRGCSTELSAQTFEESKDYGPSRTVTIGLSSLARPRSWRGWFWFVTSDGDVMRVSPYARTEPQPWFKLPEKSFGLTPPAIYSGGPGQVPDPYLVIMNTHQVLAVSLLNSDRTRIVYSPAAGRTLLSNTKKDNHHAIAEWARGVAFIEKQGDQQWLVICPFDREPWLEPIQDSSVVVGPVGRENLICFCTIDRLHWYDVATRRPGSLRFSGEFKPFTERPAAGVANLAPGVTPLAVEVSTQERRAYILGQAGERIYYAEADLGAQPVRMTAVPLPPGSFIDLNERGSFVVNASNEVREFTALGEKRHVTGRKLRGSMPAVLSNGDIIGFGEGSSSPIVCRRERFLTLGGDVQDCDEESVMGWMFRENGVALAVTNRQKMKLISWDRGGPVEMTERENA